MDTDRSYVVKGSRLHVVGSRFVLLNEIPAAVVHPDTH